MTPEQEALRFVQLIARMQLDGDEREDGSVFEQDNDDLYDTMQSVITRARRIVRRAERSKARR